MDFLMKEFVIFYIILLNDPLIYLIQVGHQLSLEETNL